MQPYLVGVLVLIAAAPSQQQQQQPFDDRPAVASEWGFRPPDGADLQAPVRAFCWRPQRGARRYRMQVATDAGFTDVVRERHTTLPVWCRPRLADGRSYHWRVQWSPDGRRWSRWSRGRTFAIADGVGDGGDDARAFDRERLLAAVPDRHPRLFLRPEQLPRLRELAAGELAAEARALVERCERLLASPPSVEEPPKYAEDMRRGSDPWRAIWWGNRKRTIAVLEGAATLAFTAQITGRDEFAVLARRLLLATAAWDPKGSTGYRYNDEAGMPFAYHFARTYTLLHDRLSADERARCRDVLAVRGAEMFAHLCPSHLWEPFNSHRNRAWHFLGEVAIALHGELAVADDWLWFAVNVFGSCYPVWSGDEQDGGWHEGTAYWRSYLTRFTWWADVMKAATGIDAYRQSPFFARAGEWPLYVMPPGTRGSGFGDLTGRLGSRDAAALTALFAGQARNGVWQWYADQHGAAAAPKAGDWVAFVRGASQPVAAIAPDALPTSRHFRGVGQVAMNTTLLAARDNVQVLFKSSPLGTQSHGYEAQNSFLLYAFGERLLIRSGRRDSYGSEHHRKWMWSTRSTNALTLDGRRGQHPRSHRAVGSIEAFATSPWCDWVEGEAGDAYVDDVERCRRGILFVKPHLVLVFDRIRAETAHTFDFWLHAEQPFTIGERHADLEVGRAACRIRWFTPDGLRIVQTDRFDPPPRERIRLVEHHLTASTTAPSREAVLLTAILPHRRGASPAEIRRAAPRDGDPETRCRFDLQVGEKRFRIRLDTDGAVEVVGPPGRFEVAAPR